jgi:hypothetical protein
MVTERHLKRWSSFRSLSPDLWTTTPSQFRSAIVAVELKKARKLAHYKKQNMEKKLMETLSSTVL